MLHLHTIIVAVIDNLVGLFFVFLVVSGGCSGSSRGGGGGGGDGESSRVPSWELSELVDGGFGLLDEPIDGLAGAVVAKAVLDVVELNGSVGGKTDAAVSGAFGRAHLAVAVFPPGGADNVAALNLHNLAADHVPHPHSRRRRCLLLLVSLSHNMFDVLLQ